MRELDRRDGLNSGELKDDLLGVAIVIMSLSAPMFAVVSYYLLSYRSGANQNE